jgi:hypothetical protein
MVRYESTQKSLGYWRSKDDYVEWEVEVAKPGSYEVRALVACMEGDHGGNYEIRIGQDSSVLGGKIQSTGSWTVYKEQPVGTVTLQPGLQRISVHNRKDVGPLMKLRSLRLVAK